MNDTHVPETDYTDALSTLAEKIISYAESEGIDPLDVAYNIHDSYKHKIGSEAYNAYDILLKHKASESIENVMDVSQDLENFMMGDVLVVADKREIVKPVREDIYTEVESKIKRV